MKYYIDCEFDGHNGDIMSWGIVCESSQPNKNIYIRVFNYDLPTDAWVIKNVMPVLDSHIAWISTRVREQDVGPAILAFLGDDEHPIIIADSPVDIGRFCRAISTGSDRQWASVSFPRMTFEVHNVDCYPTTLDGAVQHNAWWDAMALRAKLESNQTPDAMQAMIREVGSTYLEPGNVILVDGKKKVIRQPRHLQRGETFVCKTPHEDGDFNYFCGSDYCRCVQ